VVLLAAGFFVDLVVLFFITQQPLPLASSDGKKYFQKSFFIFSLTGLWENPLYNPPIGSQGLNQNVLS
jgi:hypothetical protein